MRGRKFVFNCVQFLYYKYHKKNPDCDGFYIDSLDWIKTKIATARPINKTDNECFQRNHRETVTN